MDTGETQDAIQEFALIGRYIVAFEEVLEAMRTTINSILLRNGLDDTDMRVIVTTGLTASPLKDIFRSFVLRDVYLWQQSDETKENMRLVLREILKQVDELTTKRNDIVHGTWEMGSNTFDPEVRTPMFGFKYKHSGQGLWGTLAPDPRELETLIQDCKQTKETFYRLHMALENPHLSFTLLSTRKVSGKTELVLPVLEQ